MLSRALFPTSDPALVDQGAAYAITLDNPTIASTSEIPLLLLLNPAASGKALQIFLRRLMLTTTTNAIVRFYASPTVTANGTPVVPAPMRVGGAASVITPFTGSTISANGGLIDCLFANNSALVDTSLCPIVVPAGQSLLATIKASATTSPLDFQVSWVES